MKLGWLVVRGSLVNLLCRYTFDRACRELALVYRESCRNGGGALAADTSSGGKYILWNLSS
jgi:hypothetical protein